ncbi:DUF5689 domain-containing protein [Winogradskyella pulchriflava]|uniref:DUF5689 domain-containing protein n=1 Tax=Winogradskyella pulchriflava TaxID=1110688 RepID=A0ABV6Q7D4_9FLAO
MKTTKLLTLILVAFASITITSCVEDDDYSIPNSLGDEENAGLTTIMNELASGDLTEISITDLKNLYQTYEDAQSGFDYDHFIQIPDDLVVKGYVTSSDATGNFYKEFYMQDAPENPTAAIGVLLNQVDSYNQFNLGREVYIRLKDMYVGYNSNEIISIGGQPDEDEVGQFTANQIPNKIFRSTTTSTIVPLEISLSAINESHVGMLIIANDVQFPEELSGSTYGDPSQDFDTQRTLQACEGFGYSNFSLETSSFANFYFTPLPTANGGTITAVVLKTFGGDNLVLLLNDLSDVQFDNARCTPLDINDFNVVFQDEFNNLNNWTTFNVTGAQVWGTTNFGNPAPSAYMNGYSGGAQNNEDWLISNAIDLTSVTNSFFFFETDKRYDGNDLEVYMSTDYSGGDPNSNGSWTQLDVIIDPNANSWNTWTNSGNIDVSSADGQMLYIAFKYTSTTSAAATFELDNVTVLGL